jgi:hypothetical protein
MHAGLDMAQAWDISALTRTAIVARLAAKERNTLPACNLHGKSVSKHFAGRSRKGAI